MMKSGFSLSLLAQKAKVQSRLGCVSSVGSRRFFGGGIAAESDSSVKRDMFRVGGNFYHSNKSHMLPNFVRSLAFSSASQSSGHTPNQDPKKESKILRRGVLCDEISSTKVSLNQFPGLMVHGMVRNSKTRRLLRLNPDTGYFEQEKDVAAAANHDHSQHIELQVPHRHVCRGSAYGWLFLTDNNLDMKLLNPFSGAEIQLPSVKTLPLTHPCSYFMEGEKWPLSKRFVHKAVFSANPSLEPRPVVLVIYVGLHTPRIAFCKPGDDRWTPLLFPIQETHSKQSYVFPTDAIYHNGQFYVLGLPGYVAGFHIGRRIDDDDHSVTSTVVATAAGRKLTYMRDSLLAVLDGEFVTFELGTRCFCDFCLYDHETTELKRTRDGDTSDEEMKIWRFAESEKQWVKVESLGDKAVFLGFNTSFALSASDYPAGVCIPNSIYFAYGGRGYVPTKKVRYDMGIYNVKDKSVKHPLYQQMPMDDDSEFKKPAPIWIVNSAE